MEKLDFLFSLMDRISGPAKSMAQAGNALVKELDKVNDQLKELDKQATKTRLDKVTDPLQKQRLQLRLNRDELRLQTQQTRQVGAEMREMGGSSLIAAGGLAALGAASLALTYKGLEAGIVGAKFATDALAFKETTLTALRVMTGTEASAQRIFSDALQFAKKTPFATRDVVGGFTQLLGAGFKEDEVTRVFAAIGDAAAASGFDQQVIDRMVVAFAQIKAKGRLMGQEMLQVNEALGRAGVGTTAIYDQMAKALGKSRAEVMRMQEAGTINADVAIFSIIKALEQKSGGAVGNLMAEQSKTLKGLFSTLSSVPEDFFMSFDLSRMPGFEALKGTVSNLVQVFDTTRASGKALQEALGGLFNTVFTSLFGRLSGADGMARLEAVVGRVVDYIRGITPIIGAVFSGMRGFFEGAGKALGPMFSAFHRFLGLAGNADGFSTTMERLGFVLGLVAGGLGAVVVAIGFLVTPFVRIFGVVAAAIDAVDAWWTRMTTVATEAQGWGDMVGSGLVNGLLGQLTPVGGAMAQLAAAASGTFKAALDINSPSRLFREYGEYTAEGFAQGVRGGTGETSDAVEGMGAARPGVADLGSRLGRGGATQPVNVYLQLPAGGTSEEAVSFAQKVREVLSLELPSALHVAFAGVAVEGGEG